jgi:hypothetical protein
MAEKYTPKRPGERVKTLKEKFEVMNTFVRSRHAWLVSVPGDPEVRLETLPNSPLPAELKRLGYELADDGEGERILPMGITERFTRGPGGHLVPLVVGSTAPIAEKRHHAGIVRVQRYAFTMPRRAPGLIASEAKSN